MPFLEKLATLALNFTEKGDQQRAKEFEAKDCALNPKRCKGEPKADEPWKKPWSEVTEEVKIKCAKFSDFQVQEECMRQEKESYENLQRQ